MDFHLLFTLQMKISIKMERQARWHDEMNEKKTRKLRVDGSGWKGIAAASQHLSLRLSVFAAIQKKRKRTEAEYKRI